MDTQERIEKEAIAEAILFASGTPVATTALAEALAMTEGETGDFLSVMQRSYEHRGICLVRVGEAWQLCSKPELGNAVRSCLGLRREMTLSPSMLEVLAIVAYHQPVTRAYIEQIRGVDSSYAVASLLDRALIEVQGRLDVPGRPSLLGTTGEFLRVFGLETLDKLPPIELFGSTEPLPHDSETGGAVKAEPSKNDLEE